MADSPFVRDWLKRERRVAQATEKISAILQDVPEDKARRILNAAAAYYDLPLPCPLDDERAARGKP